MKKACCAETESHGDDCIWRELYNENLGLKKERDELRAALRKAETLLDENDVRQPMTGREVAALATIRSCLSSMK